jgi:hypothetical protein
MEEHGRHCKSLEVHHRQRCYREWQLTGKYFFDNKEIPSSTQSYDTQNAFGPWNKRENDRPSL